MSTQVGPSFHPNSGWKLGDSTTTIPNANNAISSNGGNIFIKSNTNNNNNNNTINTKKNPFSAGKSTVTEKPLNSSTDGNPSLTIQPNNDIGPLISYPESYGFQRFNHVPRDLPKFLSTQQPQLTSRKFIQDHWDKLNQRKMINLEKSIDDTTELYETLKKMRDTERTMMENKGLVDKADLAKDLNEAIVFQGTCLDMCPIFERARRNVEFTVFSYERDSTEDKKASRNKALKVFARPAAAAAPPLPSDVRPPHILVKTLDYIIDNLLTTLPKSEGFLWDRMRSIRQDFTYQNYSGPEAVDCNERIVRIHLLILHVMVETNTKFSIQQELEQLHKSLITLSEIYDDMRSNGFTCPNEAEFRAYALLSKIRDPQYDQTIQELPSDIFQNELVQLAICFRQIVSNSNYSQRGFIKTENSLNFYLRFFQLLKSTEVPFLLGSFLETYLGEVRFYAMKALSLSLNKKHKPIPSQHFMDSLLFNNQEELKTFCDYYSITISPDGVDLKTLTHHSHRLIEKKPLAPAYLQCVSNKMGDRTYAHIINCGKPNHGIKRDVNYDIENSPAKAGNMNASFPRSSVSSKLAPVSDQNTISQSVPVNNQFKFGRDESKSASSFSIPTQVPNKVTDPSLLPKTTPAFTFGNVDTLSTTSMFSPLTSTENKEISLKSISSPQAQPVKSNISIEKERNALIKQQKIKQAQEQEQKEKQKKNENENYKNQVAESVTNKLIKSITSTVVESTLEKAKKIQDKKQHIINSLAGSLFNAFLHENIYNVYLLARATAFSERKLKSIFVSKWKNSYTERKNQQLLEKKHKEDLQNVQKQLGVPQFKRSRLALGTPIASSNTSFLLSSDRKNDLIFSPTFNETNNFSSKLDQKEDVWKPFDLKKLYFDKVCHRVPASMNVEIDILLYSNSWTSISNSWLLTKFGLSDSKKLMILKKNNFRLNVKYTDRNFDPKDLDHTQLIIFNTGVTAEGIFDLDLKLQKDGEELIKLINNVSARSEVCFNILIVYWDSTGTVVSSNDITRFLKLNRIEKSFNDVLLNIGFIKVTGDSPHKSLEDGLQRMARDFKCQLTERGRYKQKLHKRRSITGTQVNKASISTLATIDEKMRRMRNNEDEIYKRQQDKKNTYAHLQSHIMASPKLNKTKLPVLRSSSKQTNRFKTPIAARYASGSTPADPSHLVNKIQKKQQLTMPPGTPSHSTNFPNSSIIIHRTPVNSRNTQSNEPTHLFGIDERSQPVFETPVQAIINPMDQSLLSANESHTIQELKSIIETVKKKVNADRPH